VKDNSILHALFCYRASELKSFEEAEIFVKGKMSTAREIKGHFNDICETFQKMIEFKPEIRQNAENMIKLIKEFVERGDQKTSEARTFLKLLDTLNNEPVKEEDDTIKRDSELQHEKLNVNTSRKKSLSQEVEEDKEPIDNMRY